jgi:hypothetical protein
VILIAATLAIAQPLAPSNQLWADVCLERDHPNRCMAEAYCEWRADMCPMVRRALPHVSARELARIERIAWRREDRDRAEFHRLFCDPSIFAELVDDRPGLSSPAVEEEHTLICTPENRP